MENESRPTSGVDLLNRMIDEGYMKDLGSKKFTSLFEVQILPWLRALLIPIIGKCLAEEWDLCLSLKKCHQI